MNAFSRWLAACFVAGVYCLVPVGLPTASAARPARPRAPHLLAARSQRPAQRRAFTSAQLDYYGGHVLSRVKVDLVVWDTWSYTKSVPLTGARSIASFLGGITTSPYLDWLSEYDTPTQHIKRGALERVYTVHPPAAANGTTVSDTAIADGLRAMITDGRLPRPSTNRLYVVMLPPRADGVHTRRRLPLRLLRVPRHRVVLVGVRGLLRGDPVRGRQSRMQGRFDVVRQCHHRDVARARGGDHRPRNRLEPDRVVRRRLRRDR